MTTTTPAAPPSSAPAGEADATDRPPPADPASPPSGENHNAPQAEAPPPPPPAAAQAAPDPNRPAPTPIPLNPETFTDYYRIARWGAATQFVPKEVRNRPDDVMYMLMAGRQWGLPIVASLQLHVIDGKLCLPAQTMIAIVMGSPVCEYLEIVESTEERAVWATKRRGGRREVQLDYTIGEADRMGLLTKGRTAESASRNQWNKQPRTMLRWRAATALCRLVYPELVIGLYSTEEMVDAVESRGEEVTVERVSRAVVDLAKDANVAPAPPGLPADTAAAPDLDAVMRQAPPPISLAERVRSKAAAASASRAIATCRKCGGPFEVDGARPTEICNACARE